MSLSKGEKTKEKILDVTMDLAAEFGFTSVSYQNIADRIGISQAAVIKHFPQKSALYSSVREKASQSNQDWVGRYVEQQKSGKDKVVEYCFQTCLWAIQKPQDAQILILGYYLASTDKEMKKANLNAWKNAEEKISSYLREYYEESTQQLPESLEDQVRLIHSWVTGLAVRYFVELNQVRNKSKMRENIAKQLDMVIGNNFGV